MPITEKDRHQSSGPAADISFFPFSEGGVLFRSGTRNIWTLNHTAGALWCLLHEVREREALVDLASAQFRIAPELARRDVEQTLAHFAALGLIGSQSRPCPPAGPTPQKTGQPLPGGQERKPAIPWQATSHYRILDHVLELSSWKAAPVREFLALMGHFAVTTPSPPRLRIWLLPAASGGGGADICLDRVAHALDVAPDQTLQVLLYLVYARISALLADRLLFHAAVLAKNGKAFIFPAAAGSGKTTIAAVFARHGYAFYADELAVLEPESLLLQPLPMPMSVKPGSLPILQPLYPALVEARPYLRADGKEVRYLAPAAESLPTQNECSEPGGIFFPSHEESCTPHAARLSKAEALRRLVATCSSDRPLLERDIAALVRLVDSVDCYAIRYPGAKEALKIIDQLLPSLRRT